MIPSSCILISNSSRNWQYYIPPYNASTTNIRSTSCLKLTWPILDHIKLDYILFCRCNIFWICSSNCSYICSLYKIITLCCCWLRSPFIFISCCFIWLSLSSIIFFCFLSVFNEITSHGLHLILRCFVESPFILLYFFRSLIIKVPIIYTISFCNNSPTLSLSITILQHINVISSICHFCCSRGCIDCLFVFTLTYDYRTWFTCRYGHRKDGFYLFRPFLHMELQVDRQVLRSEQYILDQQFRSKYIVWVFLNES